MTNQIIKDRLNILDTEYRNFAASDFAPEVAKIFGEKYQFDEDNLDILENGIMMYLLFFTDKSGLEEFIVKELGFDQKEASLLATAIEMTIPDPVQEAFRNTTNYFFPPEPEGSVVAVSITDPKTVSLLTPEMIEEKIKSEPLTNAESNVIKNNLETYLGDKNTDDNIRAMWKNWSENSVFGIQFGLDIKI